MAPQIGQNVHIIESYVKGYVGINCTILSTIFRFKIFRIKGEKKMRGVTGSNLNF